MNLQAILAALGEAEQIALLFIHSKSAQQKYTLVTGITNEVLPVALGIIAAASAPAPVATAPPVAVPNGAPLATAHK